jgi:S1-C subfamily serine protease
LAQLRTAGIILAALVIGAVAGYGGAFFQNAQLQTQLAASTTELTALRSEASALREEVADLGQTVDALSRQLQRNGTTSSSGGLSVTALYEQVQDAVVSIRVNLGGGGVSQGSGFVFDREGRVVTNFHVVQGGETIEVVFLDGSAFEGLLVGTDVYSDLAVVVVQGRGRSFSPLPLGDFAQVRVGDPVIAIGNPFGLSGSLTTGIVSQKGRSLTTQTTPAFVIPNVLQIDAAINPGNSGGPLLNAAGEVIGITTAILSETGAFAGVGFAIPSSTIGRVVPSVIATGGYDHPYLGIESAPVTSEIAQELGLATARGVVIVTVLPNGPAAQAGLAAGDVLVRVDGTAIRDGDDLAAFLEERTQPGQTVSLTIIRNQAELQIPLTLGVRPPPG